MGVALGGRVLWQDKSSVELFCRKALEASPSFVLRGRQARPASSLSSASGAGLADFFAASRPRSRVRPMGERTGLRSPLAYECAALRPWSEIRARLAKAPREGLRFVWRPHFTGVEIRCGRRIRNRGNMLSQFLILLHLETEKCTITIPEEGKGGK
jgi:hypothetical protein